MDDALLTQYASITTISWLTGLIFGMGGGALTALLMRGLFSRYPDLYGLLSLTPWRTGWVHLFLLALLYPAIQNVVISFLNLSSSSLAFTLNDLGLGNNMLAASTALTLLGWLLVSSKLYHHWQATSLTLRLISLVRTMAVVAMVLTLTLDFLSGEGVGAFLARRLSLLDFNVALPLWWQFIGYTALIDLAFGVVQTVTFYVSHQSSNPDVE